MSKDTVTVVPPSYPALENEIYRSLEPVTERQTDLDGWYAEELNLGLYPESPSPNPSESLIMNDNGTRNIPAGKTVLVRGHRSAPGQGLNYPEQLVTLIDPCQTYGWDVIDCETEQGTKISIYSFSVADHICSSCDDQGCGFCVPNEPFDSNCRYGD